MIYLLCGLDNQAKEKKIAEIKAKSFSSHEAVSFDYQILHGPKLDNATLKKSLIALPSLSKKRLVLIRQADKLTTENKNLIAELIGDIKDFLIIILDAENAKAGGALKKKFSKQIKVLHFEEEAKLGVFDLTRAISQNKKANALDVLAQLLGDGTHPLQLMGGILWEWKKNRPRLSFERFKDGLLALEEADVNIKRSRLRADYALEVLVIKLCSLRAC